jgi:hypothetical protein
MSSIFFAETGTVLCYKISSRNRNRKLFYKQTGAGTETGTGTKIRNKNSSKIDDELFCITDCCYIDNNDVALRTTGFVYSWKTNQISVPVTILAETEPSFGRFRAVLRTSGPQAKLKYGAPTNEFNLATF